MATIKIKADNTGFKREIREASSVLGRFNNKLNKGVGKGVNGVNTLNSKFGRVTNSISAMLPGLRGVTTSLSSIGSSAGGAATGIGALAGGFAVAGAAAVAFSSKVTKAFADNERSLFNYARLTEDVQGTIADAEPFTRDVSERLGVDRNQIAGGLYSALSGGAADPEAVAEAAAELAAISVGNIQVSGAAEAIITVGEAGVTDPREAANLLAQAEILLRTPIDKLSASLGKVVPTLQLFDAGIEEGIAGLDTLTKSGLKADEAATQFNAVLLEVFAPNKPANKFFKETFGQSFQQSYEEIGLIRSLQKLVDGVGGLGNLTNVIQREEAVRAIGAILPRAEEFAATQEAIADTGTSILDSKLEALLDTTFNAMDRLRQIVNNTLIELGSELAPHVKELMSFLTDVLQDPVFKRRVSQLTQAFLDLGNTLVIVGSGIIDLIKDIDEVHRAATGWTARVPGLNFLINTFGGGATQDAFDRYVEESETARRERINREELSKLPQGSSGWEYRLVAERNREAARNPESALARDTRLRREALGLPALNEESALARDTRLRREAAGLEAVPTTDSERQAEYTRLREYEVDGGISSLVDKYQPQLSALEQLEVNRDTIQTALAETQALYDKGAIQLGDDIERMVRALDEINRQITDVKESNEEIAANTAPEERDVQFVYAPIQQLPTTRSV